LYFRSLEVSVPAFRALAIAGVDVQGKLTPPTVGASSRRG